MHVQTEVDNFYSFLNFDIPKWKDHRRFDHYETKFLLAHEYCQVDEVEKLSDKKVRIKFHFFGSKGKTSVIDGEEVHFSLKAMFVGSVLFEGVILIKADEESHLDTNKFIFTIKKSFFKRKRLVHIENQKVGKVFIECKKVYAEDIDCYLNKEDEWVKE